MTNSSISVIIFQYIGNTMTECLYLFISVDDDDVDTDSPRPKQQKNIPSSRLHYSDEFTPRLSDVLICQAVVHGYVALRDKNRGTF